MDSRSLLPIGTKLQMGRYRVDRYLSSGSFGNTYVITNLQFGEQYAMKEFFMKGVNEREKNHTTICVSNKVNYERYEQQRKKFKKEARRLRQLSNKHLVKVYDLFNENGTTYYVMDLIHGQTMQKAMEETGRTYTESQAINVIYQILEALDTLHQKGIWHLDLKPANIMINDQGLVKVIDFGASKQMNANLEYTSTSAAICYTPGFAPTEQVDQNISRIGPWTDLYALGATLYYMLTGSQPPSSSEILDGYDFQFKFPVSENIRQLIIWMMKPNRKDRPQSVGEVRNYLNKIQEKTPVKEKNKTIEDNRHTYKGWGIAEKRLEEEQKREKDKKEEESTRGCLFFSIIPLSVIGLIIFWLLYGSETGLMICTGILSLALPTGLFLKDDATTKFSKYFIIFLYISFAIVCYAGLYFDSLYFSLLYFTIFISVILILLLCIGFGFTWGILCLTCLLVLPVCMLYSIHVFYHSIHHWPFVAIIGVVWGTTFIVASKESSL